MNPRLVFLASLCLTLAHGVSVFADGSELAHLAPARTLAYLEWRDTPGLARELHGLTKGSYLRDTMSLFARHLENNNNNNNNEVLLFAWLGSPEWIDEIGDLQGGFLALTGLTRNDDPEIAGVLYTGKSRIVPLAFRMFLLQDDPKCIARVEKVPIFQLGQAVARKAPLLARRRRPVFEFARLLREPRGAALHPVAWLQNAPVEESDEKPEYGCFVSVLPDAIAFGTTPEILSETIRRLKNKSAGPTLATIPAFRAAALPDKPGLFAWCDPAPLTRRINDALGHNLNRRKDEVRTRPLAPGEKRDAAKLRDELRQVEVAHSQETQEWTFFQKAANPQGMLYAAARWTLQRGELSCRLDLRMKREQSSPLMELWHNEKISPELLRAVPGDAFSVVALPLRNGSATLTRVMKLLDGYAEASGEKDGLPSKSLEELEKTLKLRFGRQVAAKIRTAAVAYYLPDKNGVLPMIVLEAVNESAANELVAVWPRLYSATGKNATSKEYVINKRVIHSLTDKEDASKDDFPPHYAASGKIVYLDWHRGHVAAALCQRQNQKDLLNLRRAIDTVNAEGEIGAIGLFSCRQFFARLAEMGSEWPDQEQPHLRALRYLREMSTPMASMPPTLLRLQRLSDGLSLELRQSDLPIASATVVDIGLTWMLDEQAASLDWVNVWFGWLQPAAVAAPPPGIVAPAMPLPAAPPAPPPPMPGCK